MSFTLPIDSCLRLIRTSVHVSAHNISARLQQDGFPWNLILETSIKICPWTQNFVIIGQNLSDSLSGKSEYGVQLPATLRGHNIAVFEWNGYRIWSSAVWYKSADVSDARIVKASSSSYYRTGKVLGADKSLARPGRKRATATEDFEFHISYL
jgi:hypothetical protein